MGIGGLDREFSDIFRRAFASRVFPPDIVEQMGMCCLYFTFWCYLVKSIHSPEQPYSDALIVDNVIRGVSVVNELFPLQVVSM